MNMNTHFSTIYYFSLVTITLSMIAWTIAVGSTHVSYGQQIAGLDRQRAVLAEKKYELELATTLELSLSELAEDASRSGFLSISKITQVKTHAAVASR